MSEINALSNYTPDWTYSRSTLIEYSYVLQQIDDIRSTVSSSPRDSEEAITLRVSQAKALAILYKQLERIQNFSLLGAPTVFTKSNKVLNLMSSALAPYWSGSSNSRIARAIDALLTNQFFEEVLNKALDTSDFDDHGQLEIPAEELMLAEVFRKFNNKLDLAIGELGDTLYISSEFFEGLNLLNEACTWNPGTKYISIMGKLENKTTDSNWFSVFLDTVDRSKSSGIQKLKKISAGEYYSGNTEEKKYLEKILSKINTPLSEGGFEGLTSAESIKKMWEDRAFIIDVKIAIDLVANLNERAQHEISLLLVNSKSISDMTSKVLENQNDILTSIAKQIKL